MDEIQIRTLEDVEQFLAEPTGAQLKLQGNTDDIYKWIEHTLVRFRYPWLGKAAEKRGLALYSSAIGLHASACHQVGKEFSRDF